MSNLEVSQQKHLATRVNISINTYKICMNEDKMELEGINLQKGTVIKDGAQQKPDLNHVSLSRLLIEPIEAKMAAFVQLKA